MKLIETPDGKMTKNRKQTLELLFQKHFCELDQSSNQVDNSWQPSETEAK